MARRGITYDQVANAATAIKARGFEPTIKAIRQELGNEGSFSTISQHLTTWREKGLDETAGRDLPQEVENKMLEAMTIIWNVAVLEANNDVKALKQQQEDEKEDYEKTIKEAKDEILALEEVVNKLEDNLQKSNDKADKAIKTMTALQGELDATKKLYSELITTLKLQDSKNEKVSDTKPEHQTKTTISHENK